MKYILLILIALLGQYTFACDCEKPTFQAAYDSANLIFVGKATEVTTNWMSGGWKATFVVENSWKMPTEGVLVVNTPWEKDCGVLFQVGQKYLIYAKKKFTTKTNVCRGTRLLSEANEDLQALGEGIKPTSKANASYFSALLMILSVLGFIFLAYVMMRGRNKKHKPVG